MWIILQFSIDHWRPAPVCVCVCVGGGGGGGGGSADQGSEGPHLIAI